MTVTQASDHNTFTYAFKSGSVVLPGSTVDKAVEQDLADAGVKGATVNCPATVAVKTGTTVTCPVTSSSGRQATVSFTFSDSSGGRLILGGWRLVTCAGEGDRGPGPLRPGGLCVLPAS